MTLKGDQMVYLWNLETVSLTFCQISNTFTPIKAQEIIRILTRCLWNYSLISLVAIWLHTYVQSIVTSEIRNDGIDNVASCQHIQTNKIFPITQLVYLHV